MGKKSKILAQNFQSKAIVKGIKEIQDSKKKILAWKIFGNVKVSAHVKLKIVRSHRNELVFEVSKENFDYLLKITTGQEKVNFYIPDGNILFQCRIKEVSNEHKTMVVYLPEQLVRQERRKALRVRTDGKNVKVNFKKEISPTKSSQLFDKKCYDLSKGGVSFILSQTESKFFQKEEVVKSANISIDGEAIGVDMELVNLIPVDPDPHNELAYKGFKACFKFVKISVEDINKIDIFVMSNIDLEESA